MTEELMNYFNKQPRLGVLATADKHGKVNAAYFGTPKMIDTKTICIALAKNRSFDNLQENPRAVYVIMEPGPSVPEWKGVRVYLKMTDCQTSGKLLDAIRSEVASAAGENAAKMLYGAVTFTIEEVRPLADFGQGWEKSI